MSTLHQIHEKYGRFESWFYDRYIASGSMPSKVQVLAEKLHALPPGASVLDIGCGGGQVLAELFRLRPDLQFTGIDNSSRQIEKAKVRLGQIANHVHLQEASVMDLPFADNSFDFAYSLASIKHWPRLAKGLESSMRVLRPGGYLIVTELDSAGTDEQIRDFIGRWSIPNRLKRFLVPIYRERIVKKSLSSSEIVEVLRKLGADQIKSFPFPMAPAFVVEALRVDFERSQ
jgi:ubiquinone/menaquinone biosynthesis C-methylase UbiE